MWADPWSMKGKGKWGGKGDFMWGDPWGGKGKGMWGDPWAGKGDWGGGGGGDWGGEKKERGASARTAKDDGVLHKAVKEAAQNMGSLEKEWDAEQLEGKLWSYFTKGAKKMEFKGRELAGLIDEYADNVMAQLFAGAGDRDWLLSGEVDFLLILDAGIKDLFPNWCMKKVEQPEFEALVLAAYERAFDEQRFWPILAEKLAEHIQGPKIKKKVSNSVDQGRKDTWQEGCSDGQEFAKGWIDASVSILSEASGGKPDQYVSAGEITGLFNALFEGNGLPLQLKASISKKFTEDTVVKAFLDYTEAMWDPETDGARGATLTGNLKNWGQPNYGGFGTLLYAHKKEVDAKNEVQYQEKKKADALAAEEAAKAAANGEPALKAAKKD